LPAELVNTGRFHQVVFAGAGLQAKSNNGRIPLEVASNRGHTQAVEILKYEINTRFRTKGT
jgi:acyl dehydratase